MSSLGIAGCFPFARIKLVGRNVHLQAGPGGTMIGPEVERADAVRGG